jgi:hypothetical protein
MRGDAGCAFLSDGYPDRPEPICTASRNVSAAAGVGLVHGVSLRASRPMWSRLVTPRSFGRGRGFQPD